MLRQHEEEEDDEQKEENEVFKVIFLIMSTIFE